MQITPKKKSGSAFSGPIPTLSAKIADAVIAPGKRQGGGNRSGYRGGDRRAAGSDSRALEVVEIDPRAARFSSTNLPRIDHSSP